MTPVKDSTRDERGAAMIYVALFLLSSLWFVSLAIDMGKLSATRTELQRAADAAALAAASAIDMQNGGTLIQDEARARAAATAAANTALQERSEAVTIDPDADVSFPDIANHKVRVTVHRDAANGNAMTTIFARAIGIGSLDLAAHAVAEAVPVTGLCHHILPFAPVVVAGGYSTACGTTYTLHADPSAANGGNFQLLSYPSCPTGPCSGPGMTGGKMVECLMEHGYDCCVQIGTTFANTKPGGTVGPVRQGLQARWDADSDRRTGICYQDYTGSGERVMPVPIVQTFDLSGRTNATITGFAGFFMLSRPSGGANNMDIVGQFIDYMQPGVAGSNPPPPNAVYTVRLVE